MDQDTLNLFLMCLSIVIGIALQTWGLIRYLTDRQDAGDRRLADEIKEVSQNKVGRKEYEKDAEAFYSGLRELRGEVRDQGSATTSRLDALIQTIINK